MGVYLSTPNTEKHSTDETCQRFTYGSSSMQGWRMSQEDAHNCIPEFDEKTSLFAVYDGHGGAEVAQYCATNFPQFLKETKNYKEGNFSDALEEAFLGFDALLTTPKAIKELKVLAGVESDDEESPEKKRSKQKTEAELLRQEADMPIEDLMAQYESGESGQPRTRILRRKVQVNSPVIKPKKLPYPTDTDKDTVDSNIEKKDREETKISNGHAENENNINLEKESQMSSSSTIQQNTVSSTADSASVLQADSCSSSSISVKDEAGSSASADTCGTSSTDVPSGSSQSGSGSADVEKSSSKPSDYQQKKETNCEGAKEKVNEVNVEMKETSDIDDGKSSSDLPESSNLAGGSADISNSAVGSSDIADSCSGSSVDCAGGSGIKKSGKNHEDEEEDIDDEEDEDFSGSDDDDEDAEFDSQDEEEEEDESEEDELDEDEEMVAIEEEPHTEEPGSDSGSTAVVAIIKDKQVFVANAGDSRCVLCRGGKAVDLSFDHKPEDESERNRIQEAGGKVTEEGRVNGGLNLSRALGDHFYKRNTSKTAKEQMITALPDIETATLQENDEFLVLACDGIWNYMSSQEVVDFIKEKLKEEENRKRLSLVCEQLFDKCLAPNTLGDGTGCDNMTCIIVTFDQIWNNNKNKRPAENTEDMSDKRRRTEDLGT